MSELNYLDHAATTPMHPDVFAAMEPFLRDRFGNPSSLYAIGRAAKTALDDARDQVAETLGCRPEELIFTSCGTEANNMALLGTAWGNQKRGNHIVTSQVEHHAVLEPCHFLEKQGFEVTYLPVDRYGVVNPNDLRAAIKDSTILVSIMHANNEVGTVQPLSEVAAVAKERGVTFHTDAVQTVGSQPVNVDAMGCAMLTLSAHKFYGPKGIGALYVRKGTRLAPLIRGGGQERNKRAGTENVAGVVGLAKALELATGDMAERGTRLRALRDQLRDGLLDGIGEHAQLTGHPEQRLDNNLSICIHGAEGEAMLLLLDMNGICASSGSACTSGTLDPSHVLLAMGVPAEIAHGSLRFTLGRDTTQEQVNNVIEVLPPIVERLLAMSPLKI